MIPRWAPLVLTLLLASCTRLTAPDGVVGPLSGGGFEFSGGATQHTSAALTSAVPDLDRVRVEWRSTNLEGLGVRAALFLSADPATLFEGSPTVVDVNERVFVFEGLEPGTTYTMGLAISPEAGAPMTPAGPTLSVICGAPIYADPDAPFAGADGLTPDSAFPNLFLALLTANLNGGGNVWVTEGLFQNVSLPLFAGVDLYGGFPKDFDLLQRDPLVHETRLEGLAADSMIRVEVGDLLQRIDGLTLDGLGIATIGIDVDSTPAELRRLDVRHCDRGLRLRTVMLDDPTPVTVVASTLAENALEGLSLEGPHSVRVDACTFLSNGQEGLEFGPWSAPPGQTVQLSVSNSRFLANGFEGLDVDMIAPPSLGPGGVFEIALVDCDFEENGGHGCLIDVDYETSPLWSGRVLLRGSQARANRGHGFMLDIDSHCETTLQRLLASANAGNGLLVTSEVHAGLVLVSSCAFVGNLGQGVHTSIGNVGVALSHCLLIGNMAGGLRADAAPASVASSASHLQANAFGAARLESSLELSSDPLPFNRAAIEYRRVLGRIADDLLLDAAASSAPGGAAEVAADGVLRVLTDQVGAQVTLVPAPEGLSLPGLCALFEDSASVDENYGPRPGSELLFAGMRQADGTRVDAGVFGSPQGGAPGVEALVPAPLFRVVSSSPAWGRPIGSQEAVRVSFAGGVPDVASLVAGLQVCDASGVRWPVDSALDGSDLVVSAPAAGWATGDVILLHASLTSLSEGRPLIPMALLVGEF